MRALLIVALCTATTATTVSVAPAAADRPTQVTRRLMRDLLTGQRPWAALIDPATGVFDLSYRTGDFDGDVRWGRRGCDLRAPLRRIAQLFGPQLSLEELELSCRNRGGAHTCTLDGVGEFMPAWRFEFRSTPTGLVLDTVAEINSVYNPADQERVLRKLKARARPVTCAP